MEQKKFPPTGNFPTGIRNYLTIDVEDYYQVTAFEMLCGPEKWGGFPSRVVRNTEQILKVLDRHGVRATFFVLGWTAEKFPDLVKKIAARGHEIGCHSYYHRLVYNLSPEEFREDTRMAKDVLEQVTGREVRGYRAPSYSITESCPWAFAILEELGFGFDSSIFPIYHDRYGVPGAPRFRFRIPGHELIEYPISTTLWLNQKIPIGGGGYFRLFPYALTRRALAGINEKEKQPFVFYLHPWEIDPGQPRMSGISAMVKFRHYLNLHKTTGRLSRLLQDFEFTPLPNQGQAGEA